MDLAHAIARHSGWKLKMRSAILNEKTLDNVIISSNICCDLGKWLGNEGHLKYGHLNAYQPLVEIHTEFHREAGKVAALINMRQYLEAELQLSKDAPFSLASINVIFAISNLQREIPS